MTHLLWWSGPEPATQGVCLHKCFIFLVSLDIVCALQTPGELKNHCCPTWSHPRESDAVTWSSNVQPGLRTPALNGEVRCEVCKVRPTCSQDAPWLCQGPVCGDSMPSCPLERDSRQCGRGWHFLTFSLCLTGCDLPVALQLPKKPNWGNSMIGVGLQDTDGRGSPGHRAAFSMEPESLGCREDS